ncbi:MAG: hypothetical protein C0404_08110 [Verrucomicrobia bacterium]|nr:hypothetical protein [Verrucomicrobiota bacterium]
MNFDTKKLETRRDFFRSVGRWSLVGLVGAVSGWLVHRNMTARRNPEVCDGGGICSRCGELSGCGLPQALSAKRASTGMRETGR